MAQTYDPQRIPVPTALLWVLLSTIAISGSISAAWFYSQHLKQSRLHDSSYAITTLAHTGPEREPLPTGYLMEQLGLSADQPTNLYAFQIDTARNRLLQSPLIAEAVVKTISPHTVYVDYTVRKPVAYLGDYTNTAIDATGLFFPCEPFFTPKKLPTFFLGLPSDLPSGELWGERLAAERFQTAMAVLQKASQIICGAGCRIVKIDTSKADMKGYGQRQVILVVEEMVESTLDQRPVLRFYTYILRLAPLDYDDALRNFLVLRPYLREKNHSPSGEEPVLRYPFTVIDLRLPDLAYIE